MKYIISISHPASRRGTILATSTTGRCTRSRRGVLLHFTEASRPRGDGVLPVAALDAIDAFTEAFPPTQEQRKKKANDLKNSSTAKQKEKDDVRKLLDKKPKKAKKKKPPTLEKAPLGALKTTDKKSELAPIGKATSPEVSKKEPKRTGGDDADRPKRTGGDDADRPPSRTVWKSLLDGVEVHEGLRNNSHVDAHAGRARATSSRRRSPRRIPTSPRRSTRRKPKLKAY